MRFYAYVCSIIASFSFKLEIIHSFILPNFPYCVCVISMGFCFVRGGWPFKGLLMGMVGGSAGLGLP